MEAVEISGLCSIARMIYISSNGKQIQERWLVLQWTPIEANSIKIIIINCANLNL
jgi:GTP cyclohydrolase I